MIGKELAKCLVDIWLKAEFSGGGSLPKVKRIGEVEQYYFDKVKNKHLIDIFCCMEYTMIKK